MPASRTQLPQGLGQGVAADDACAEHGSRARLDHQGGDVAVAFAWQQECAACGRRRADQHPEVLRVGDAVDGQQRVERRGRLFQKVFELPVPGPAQICSYALVLTGIARDVRQGRTVVLAKLCALAASQRDDLVQDGCFAVAAGEMQAFAPDLSALQRLEHGLAAIDRQAATETRLALGVLGGGLFHQGTRRLPRFAARRGRGALRSMRARTRRSAARRGWRRSGCRKVLRGSFPG